ncbi:MAG: acyl--CoA ligase [Clostridia bacterium]|nr:acyl--CoA ligase [Clostridia bacterium]MBQ8469327.1 acyl--CoA ligase [Clostridia bacterium]
MNNVDTNKRLPSIEKPWMQFFSEEAQKAEVPKATLYEAVHSRNAGFENDTALVYLGKEISYKEFFRNVNKAASAFEALGVRKGDVVGCASVTIPEMAYAMYGLSKIGATIMTLDPRLSADAMKLFLKKSGASVMLLIDNFYEKLTEDLCDSDLKKLIIISPDTSLPMTLKVLKQFKMPRPKVSENVKVIRWESFVKTGSDKAENSYTATYGENDVAAITLTGGTTGMPKGVMLSNDGFNAVATSFENCGVRYTRDQKFLNIIPSFASYGIVASLHMPLFLGVTDVIIPKFDQDKVGEYVKKYRPAHTLMVPAHYEKLMNSKEMQDGFDLSFFETAGSGGDTMNAGTEAKLNGFLKDHGSRFPLSQGYGMSEVSSAGSCYCNGNFRSLSVGYPLLTNTISIFEPGTSNELTYGEEGEICMTGPQNMIGYLNDPEETANVMIEHPDGQVWIHSGDIGYIDEDGFLFIKGRIKRMVTMFNGHKIFPAQIEGVISKHPAVRSCACVGADDLEHAQGENPIAFVVLKEGENQAAVLEELKAMYVAELDDLSRPVDTVFMEHFPREGMGKISYKTLSKDYNEAQARAKAAKAG